jgi:hypothetical protein
VPDNSGAVDLGSLSPEEQAKVEEMAEQSYPGDQDPGDNKPKVLTAFAVVVGYDGNPQVISYEHDDFLVQSQPTGDLIYGACATILKDMNVQETGMYAAQATQQLMMQQARAMAEQQQAAQIAQNLPNLRR